MPCMPIVQHSTGTVAVGSCCLSSHPSHNSIRVLHSPNIKGLGVTAFGQLAGDRKTHHKPVHPTAPASQLQAHTHQLHHVPVQGCTPSLHFTLSSYLPTQATKKETTIRLQVQLKPTYRWCREGGTETAHIIIYTTIGSYHHTHTPILVGKTVDIKSPTHR